MSHIKLAADLDTLRREEIDELVRHNFTLTMAAGHQAGLATVSRVEELSRLPLLSPADLSTMCPPRSHELLLGGMKDVGGLVLRTSGSSGRRKTLYHSWEFTERVGLLGARGVRASLPEPPARIANCLHPADLNGAFLFCQDIGRLLPALTFPFGSDLGSAEAVEVMSEHQVDTLVAAPSYAADLAAAPASERLTALRAILYIGEPLGPAREALIAKAFPGLLVRSLAYSTSETGPIGYQCAELAGTAHHIHEDAVIVEVVDEVTGEPKPPGEAGELVITPLSDTGMALRRYRIGDRGRLQVTPCSCGSAARVLHLSGRVTNSITVDTTTLSTDLLAARMALLGAEDPTGYQLQILWDPSESLYRVHLLLAPGTANHATEEKVRECFAGAYQLARILSAERCAEFVLRRVPPADFARTDRGKTPVLHQRIEDVGADA